MVEGRSGGETPAPTPNPKSRGDAKALRGTRMDPSFQCPDHWLDWACEVFKIDRQRAMREFVEFRDYWTDIPGKSGLKIQWFPTFKNRLRELRKRGSL